MKKVLSLVAAMGLLSFVGCGDGDEATGTCAIQGIVESFETAAPVAARILAAVPGIVVYIDGPVSRNTTTDANGSFSFSSLPAGDYSLRFTYNGEEVTYRGESGQEAMISVAENQTVEVTIRVSGGHVNIGNLRVINNEPVDDSNGGAGGYSLAGTWNAVLSFQGDTRSCTFTFDSQGNLTAWGASFVQSASGSLAVSADGEVTGTTYGVVRRDEYGYTERDTFTWQVRFVSENRLEGSIVYSPQYELDDPALQAEWDEREGPANTSAVLTR